VEKQTSSAIRQEVFEKDHELGELVHRIQKLFWMGDKDEARALLDDLFRREPSGELLAHRNRLHSLLDDNPCSG
jgi:hypothetical protein